jgi:hypothetical protein
MRELDRVCQRAGCTQPASVTLSFRYDARQASLVDLLPEKHPALYDLCDAHADLLIVPRGWERLDRRRPPADPLPVAATAGAARAPMEPNMDRYAVLTAQLPQLAEALGVLGREGVADEAGATADARPRGGPAHDRDGGQATPAAWSTGEFGERRGTQLFEPVTGTLLHDDMLDGQLQMPIEPEPQGVVVALTRSRNQ